MMMAHELVVTATMPPCLLFTVFPPAFTLLAVAVAAVDMLVVMISVPVMMRVGGLRYHFRFTRSAGIVSQCSFARQVQQAQA